AQLPGERESLLVRLGRVRGGTGVFFRARDALRPARAGSQTAAATRRPRPACAPRGARRHGRGAGGAASRELGTAHPAAGAGPERRAALERSEEHTSELQSLAYLVCRLLLEKKKKKTQHNK